MSVDTAPTLYLLAMDWITVITFYPLLHSIQMWSNCPTQKAKLHSRNNVAWRKSMQVMINTKCGMSTTVGLPNYKPTEHFTNNQYCEGPITQLYLLTLTKLVMDLCLW